MSKATKREDVRKLAEADLLTFIKLIAPHRVLGAIHEELIAWMTRPDAKDNQLVLLPRDHQKSAMIAYRVAWWLTKHPETTILYVSATEGLAVKQLKFIKDIFTSRIYRHYWPEMVNDRENYREKWSETEISLDHPVRKAEGIRDPSIKAIGITANITGAHCNICVLDDLMVPTNAYTETGRESVRALYSQLSSVETTGAQEWCVGTRYHPADIYKDMLEMKEQWENEEGEVQEEEVYEVFQRVVEENGEFLWPKQRRADGKAFGFDEKELARKRAKYLDSSQFHAQYYNNPNMREEGGIQDTHFQYYSREHLVLRSGVWYLGEKMLNVYAAMDFAWTLNKRSDYTVIVVVGVDSQGFIYILDIDRFRTDSIKTMYERAAKMHNKWRFQRLRAEVTQAQKLIVNQFKEYMRTQAGSPISIDEFNPRGLGTKEERIAAALQPRYENGVIWHYKGGHCQVLEDELKQDHPEHDDVKDTLATVVEIAHAPSRRSRRSDQDTQIYHSRFGGVAY